VKRHRDERESHDRESPEFGSRGLPESRFYRVVEAEASEKQINEACEIGVVSRLAEDRAPDTAILRPWEAK